MEILTFDLIKIFLQALFFLAVVLIAIWFYFRINPKQLVKGSLPMESPAGEKDVLNTLRLQACERLILFLERIAPNNLILRVNTPDMTASQLQAALIRTIREEFEYNLSQQLYLSANTWELIRSAKEEAIRQINLAATDLKTGGSALDLAGAILQISLAQERSSVTGAIEAIKREIN